jgi:Ser/Thr protein kinase RdoA (MazF antagonist)
VGTVAGKVALRVFKWVEGTPLVGIATAAVIETWGALLGSVQSVLSNAQFDHPGLHRCVASDL